MRGGCREGKAAFITKRGSGHTAKRCWGCVPAGWADAVAVGPTTRRRRAPSADSGCCVLFFFCGVCCARGGGVARALKKGGVGRGGGGEVLDEKAPRLCGRRGAAAGVRAGQGQWRVLVARAAVD